jgi:phage shock protein PspC (stress-responsive transcriptional regulator)
MSDQQTSTAAPPPPAPGAPPPASTPLRRSRSGKAIAGVCGGLGRSYDLDPVVFRVVLAVLALAGGVGLIVYGFAWLLIPVEGQDENEGRRLLSGRVEGPALTALLFTLAGSALLLSTVGNPNFLFFSVVTLGALGGAAHWSRHRRTGSGGVTDPAADPTGASAGSAARRTGREGAPPETQAPPTAVSLSWWRDPLTKDGTAGTTGTGYLWGPADTPLDPRDDRSAHARRGADRPRGIGGSVFLLAVAAFTAGVLVSWDGQQIGRTVETGLACALAVFGLGMVVSAWFGRTGAGTVALSLLTALLLTGAAAVSDDFGTWTRTRWAPASAAAVRPHYEVGAGVVTLDLSAVKLGKDGAVVTGASLGAGKLKAVVARDVVVELSVNIGLGDLRLPGEGQERIDVSPGLRERLTLRPPDGVEARGTIVLTLHVGAGQAEVARAAS